MSPHLIYSVSITFAYFIATDILILLKYQIFSKLVYDPYKSPFKEP